MPAAAIKPTKENGEKQALSRAVRSSFEETTFGRNAGDGPNASRNVAFPRAGRPKGSRRRR